MRDIVSSSSEENSIKTQIPVSPHRFLLLDYSIYVVVLMIPYLLSISDHNHGSTVDFLVPAGVRCIKTPDQAEKGVYMHEQR